MNNSTPPPRPGDYPSPEAIEAAKQDDKNWQGDLEFVAAIAECDEEARQVCEDAQAKQWAKIGRMMFDGRVRSELTVSRSARNTPTIVGPRPRQTHVQPRRRRSGSGATSSGAGAGDDDPPSSPARLHVGGGRA